MRRDKVVNRDDVLNDHRRILGALEDRVKGIAIDILSGVQAGLRRDTGAAAQAGASVVVDLSKASNDDVMKLAQAKLLRQNRTN